MGNWAGFSGTSKSSWMGGNGREMLSYRTWTTQETAGVGGSGESPVCGAQCETAWFNTVLKLRQFGKAKRREQEIEFKENKIKPSLRQLHSFGARSN